MRRKKVQPSVVAPAPQLPIQATAVTEQPDRYTLELVVATASKFVTGEDYQTAARRSLALIDACREQAEQHRSNQTPRWSFVKGLGRFTGTTNQAEARDLFRIYLHDWWLHHQHLFRSKTGIAHQQSLMLETILVPEPTDAEDKDALKHADFMLANHERDGFTSATLDDLSETFPQWKKKRRSLSASKRGRKGGLVTAALKLKKPL